MIGDSANDVLTGRNAGLWTVGVNYGFAPQTLDLTPPDIRVDSVQELAKVLS
jgi:phosphoglycolate phosphatase